MKKVLCILTVALTLCGCSKDSGNITIACEKGFDCGEITKAVEDYYKTGNITVSEVDKNEILSGDYTVAIGSVPMGEALDFGLWKSKPIKHETACVVSRDEYKMSTDLENVNVGVPEGFEYIRFINVPEGAKITSYKDRNALISDLKEGVIGAVVCSDSIGGEIAASVDGARVNTLLDSEIYEYAVLSEDIELINSLDTVIK